MTADNYTHTTAPEYARRMGATLDRKWAALEPYVTPGARILDYGCGMPNENGIRQRVEAAGGVYECHDISATVESAMRDSGATFRTKKDLQDRAGRYDVVFLSSVLHEFTSQDDSFEEIENTWGLVAKGVVAIVRDWTGVRFQLHSQPPRMLKATSEEAMREILAWVGALAMNGVIRIGNVNNYKIDWDNLELHADPTSIYEIALHSVCGPSSLPRESGEWYGEAQNELGSHIRYWGDCTVEQEYDEWDETYLTHLQRLYNMTDCRGQQKPSSSYDEASKRHARQQLRRDATNRMKGCVPPSICQYKNAYFNNLSTSRNGLSVRTVR